MTTKTKILKRTKKDDTRKQIGVYFQMDEETSKDIYNRLEHIAKVNGISLSSIVNVSLRWSIERLEDVMLPPGDVAKKKKSV